MAKHRKRRRGRGEGAVFYSEAKGCWIARPIVGQLPNGKPKYREVTGRTKGEAMERKRQTEEDAGAGRITEAGTMTAGQARAWAFFSGMH